MGRSHSFVIPKQYMQFSPGSAIILLLHVLCIIKVYYNNAYA